MKTTLQTVHLEEKIKVVINNEVLDKMKYLCKMIPKVEWSGIPFYTVEGDIKDPKNMTIHLVDILPMNKGNKTYTEFSYDKKFTQYMMEDFETRSELVTGLVHSHNSMNTFFSGTDNSELRDNAVNHNFYFSLIVNNYMEMTAKVAVHTGIEMSLEKVNYEATDRKGKKYPIGPPIKLNIKQEKVFIYNCSIEYDNPTIEVDDDFKKRVNTIIEEAAKKEANKNKFNNPSMVNYGNTSSYYNQNLPKINKAISTTKKPNPISKLDKRIKAVNSVPMESMEKLKNTIISEENIELLMLDMLIGNKDDKKVFTLEACYEQYEDLDKDKKLEAVKEILESYPEKYDEHFKDFKSDDDFIEVTQYIIDELEMSEINYHFLSNLVLAFKSLLKNFKNGK